MVQLENQQKNERKRAAKPVDLVGFLVQPWCNWGGKDGNYALYGQFAVNYIERMDKVFPHGKDIHLSRTIRSQTLYPLSYGCVVNKLYRRGEISQFRGTKYEFFDKGGFF